MRLRFPSEKSVAEVTRKRYNDNIVKQIRKFEKLDYKIRKNEADLELLKSCLHNQLTPTFLNFKVASSNLRYSKTYRKCQRQLLKQEIKDKANIICKQKKEFNSLKMSIKSKVSILDFSHISCLFLVGNDKKILNAKEIHIKKLKELELVAGLKSHDPDKIIANYSTCNLWDNEKKPLAKGLNFAVPPRKLNYADYLASYELMFRDVKNLCVEDNILERIKVYLKKICFSSLDRYKFEDKINLTKEEMQVLRNLSSRKDIIIQKADKENSVVILNKSDYLKRMKEILSDIDKFKKLNVKPGKELNCLLQHEDKLVNFLKRVEKSLREYTKICIHEVHNQGFYMVCPKFTNHLLIIFQN